MPLIRPFPILSVQEDQPRPQHPDRREEAPDLRQVRFFRPLHLLLVDGVLFLLLLLPLLLLLLREVQAQDGRGGHAGSGRV